MSSRSQWPHCLRRGSAAVRLLGLWFRIPPGAWMFVSCECCVLSGRGSCDGPIPRPGEFYRVWCVWVWSWGPDNEEALAHWGLLRHRKKRFVMSKRAQIECRILEPPVFACEYYVVNTEFYRLPWKEEWFQHSTSETRRLTYLIRHII
jgi:hypothetical protein